MLDKLEDLSTYSGIDKNAKGRHFNKGITDPALETVIASVSGNTNPKSFDECVERFNNFIQQKEMSQLSFLHLPQTQVQALCIASPLLGLLSMHFQCQKSSLPDSLMRQSQGRSSLIPWTTEA